MKKTLLLLFAIAIGLFTYAQVNYKVQPVVKVAKIPDVKIMTKAEHVAVKAPVITSSINDPVTDSYLKGTDVVTIIPIGNAANAYGYGYNNGAATFVWADQNLNTVINTHRMTVSPNSGNLAIDVSFDGGQNWEINREMYNVTIEEYRARYPQGAIYNPQGNTDPNNAYAAYFAASLDGSNGVDWGSYTYGTASLGDPLDTIVHYLTSDLDNGFYQGIPTAFTITQQGDAWMADASLLDSYTEYLGDIIFMHGIFDPVEGDYDYERFLVSADCDYARYLKMAFSPDGQIGYIFWNNFDGSIPYLDDWSYPLLLKTTDGGLTWDDELISVEICGEYGLDGIKNWLSDEMLDELFGAGQWDRDELLYSTPWFNSDIAVDAFGNPHLLCTVFLCADDPGYIIVEPETFAVFDIYTVYGDDTWYAQHLGTLKTYQGNFEPDDFDEYNRVQVATTWDHTKLFVTWLDTDLEGVTDNNQPDIYARGFDLISNCLTGDDVGADLPNNVTIFSTGMWQAYFQATSQYALEDDAVYTIPIVYEDMDPLNVADPVQFMYIQNFSYTEADFIWDVPNPDFPVGIEPFENNLTFVSQNYPNPFSSTSVITVKLEKATDLGLEVFNLTGQKVFEINNGKVGAGSHTLTINASNLSSGVYFYTVFAGENSVTKKMIVN